MRVLRKNQQKLYYSLHDGSTPEYAHEEKYLLTEEEKKLLTEGNDAIIIDPVMMINVDGQDYMVVSGYKDGYTEPVEFKANISFDSGNTQVAEYGLDPSNYNAVISAEKGKLSFNERTLIWHKSPIQYDEQGNVKPESADYRVIAIKTSLNEERFILKKRVDDE